MQYCRRPIRLGWGYTLPILVGLSVLMTLSYFPLDPGLFTGAAVMRHQHTGSPDRKRVLEETTWTNRPEPNPILSAVVEILADIEDSGFRVPSSRHFRQLRLPVTRSTRKRPYVTVSTGSMTSRTTTKGRRLCASFRRSEAVAARMAT